MMRNEENDGMKTIDGEISDLRSQRKDLITWLVEENTRSYGLGRDQCCVSWKVFG